jgi:hypothetical protein
LLANLMAKHRAKKASCGAAAAPSCGCEAAPAPAASCGCN